MMKNWKIWMLVAALAMAIVVAINFLHANPPLNSAIAAHGNTDWHIDTANEFLFGTDQNDGPSARPRPRRVTR